MQFKHFFTIIISLIILPAGAQDNKNCPGKGDWSIIDYKGEVTARHENSFVEVNGKFYLLGGRGIKPVEIYDPQTNKWKEASAPPLEIHHFQAVAYDGIIYVIGAMTGGYPDEEPLSRIMIYDPEKDEWQQGDEIPKDRRRGSAGVVVYEDKAIVLSGIVEGHRGNHVEWVDAYHFSTGRWERLQDAPRARDHFHAARKGSKIYCAGGRLTSYKTGQTFELTVPGVDIYDLDSNSWSSLPEEKNIPTPRAGTSSVILDNHLIVIGGESGTQETAHDDVEALCLDTREWSTLSPLVRGRHGTQAILYRNAIYTIAGSGNRGGRPELSSLEKFEWTKSGKKQ